MNYDRKSDEPCLANLCVLVVFSMNAAYAQPLALCALPEAVDRTTFVADEDVCALSDSDATFYANGQCLSGFLFC